MIIQPDHSQYAKTRLHKLRHPGITAVKKWKYNEKRKRKWRENVEMERECDNGEKMWKWRENKAEDRE